MCCGRRVLWPSLINAQDLESSFNAGSGLEFDDQLGWHSAVVLYLDALRLGPPANLVVFRSLADVRLLDQQAPEAGRRL